MTVFRLPADQLAIEMGNIKYANMIMLGALISLIDGITPDSWKRQWRKK